MSGRKKITKTQQRIASDILTAFMFVKDMGEHDKVWKDLYDFYELNIDPFTYTSCATEDYYTKQREYERQIMMEKYGHCDGLE